MWEHFPSVFFVGLLELPPVREEQTAEASNRRFGQAQPLRPLLPATARPPRPPAPRPPAAVPENRSQAAAPSTAQENQPKPEGVGLSLLRLENNLLELASLKKDLCRGIMYFLPIDVDKDNITVRLVRN